MTALVAYARGWRARRAMYSDGLGPNVCYMNRDSIFNGRGRSYVKYLVLIRLSHP